MVATLVDRDVIRVTGDEAAFYLQGQLSQDVDALAVGDTAWSLVLEPNGKLTGWFRVHRLDDREFLIDTEAGTGDAVLARLRRFVLRTAVEFSTESGWRMLSVRGEAAPAVDGLRADVEWPEFRGVDVLAPGLEAPDLAVDPAAFEAARVAAGVPRIGVDLDDETIPGEGGAAFLDTSVSFTKGCYTGQELVARVDSRGGNVPRPLRRLEADAPLTVGAAIEADGAQVGTLTSAAGPVGLGRVMRKVEPGREVHVGGVAAVVSALERT